MVRNSNSVIPLIEISNPCQKYCRIVKMFANRIEYKRMENPEQSIGKIGK